MGLRGNITYKRTLSDHSLGAVFAARYFQREVTGVAQDRKELNLTLRLNYDYAKRYFVEVAVGRMGSNFYFGSKSRFMIAPTVGAAWLASNEDFMSDVSWLDHLKIKDSAGILGVDTDVVPVLNAFCWLE